MKLQSTSLRRRSFQAMAGALVASIALLPMAGTAIGQERIKAEWWFALGGRLTLACSPATGRRQGIGWAPSGLSRRRERGGVAGRAHQRGRIRSSWAMERTRAPASSW